MREGQTCLPEPLWKSQSRAKDYFASCWKIQSWGSYTLEDFDVISEALHVPRPRHMRGMELGGSRLHDSCGRSHPQRATMTPQRLIMAPSGPSAHQNSRMICCLHETSKPCEVLSQAPEATDFFLSGR